MHVDEAGGDDQAFDGEDLFVWEGGKFTDLGDTAAGDAEVGGAEFGACAIGEEAAFKEDLGEGGGGEGDAKSEK
jgi:hypothetical protein